MTCRLLPLPDNLLSLEFEPGDFDRLRETIRASYGSMGQGWVGPYAGKVEFGGETFTYQDEWDEPCLIAGTPGGAGILRALHARLAG